MNHDRLSRQLAHAEYRWKRWPCSKQEGPVTPALAPDDDLPAEYWQALLEDAGSEVGPSGSSIAALRLAEITRHLLRVSCRRCSRTVEIQKVNAIRLYGERAVWKDVGRRDCWTIPVHSGRDVMRKTAAGRSTVHHESHRQNVE